MRIYAAMRNAVKRRSSEVSDDYFHLFVFFASLRFVFNCRHNISTNMNTNTNINIIFLFFFCALYVNRPKGEWRTAFFYFVNSFFFLNFYAYCPSFFNFIFRSFRQSLNGDCWRGLFSPPKPIAQMAIGGEGPFFLVYFSFLF